MDFKSKKKVQDFTAKFYFPGSSKKSGVELRLITDEMRRDAYKVLVTEDVDFALHPVTHRLTKVVTPIFKNRDLEDWNIDTMIASWWGISIDGEEVECTKDNKVMLYREYPEFCAFVDESEKALKESAEKSFGGASEIKN